MNNLSLVFAISFFFFSFICYYKLKNFDQTLFTTIGENLMINDESKESFKGWQKPPVDIFMKIHLFNITNKDGILNNKEPFILKEIGPYTYKETREKINVTINNENSTVKYVEKKSWVFVPELSNGSLDDRLTHLNIPLISAYNEIMRLGAEEFMLEYLKSIIEIKEIEMFLTHSVDEILFKGYEDALLDNANVIGLKVPKKFGFFFERNNTLTKEFEVDNGYKSLINFGKIVTYDNKETLNYWSNDSCNQLNQSTTGDLNPPFQKKIPDTVNLFADDLCRSLPLKYNGSINYKFINTNRYILPSYAFDYEKESENQCYCLEKKCPLNGIYENPLCTQNSTASISFPHFMYADSKYLENVKGMNPDKDKHTFYFDIEPILGLVTKASGKLQINFKLSKINYSDITLTNFMQENDIVVPSFWVSTEAELSFSIYFGLYFIQNVLPNLGNILGILFLFISFMFTWYFIYTKFSRNQKVTPKPDKIERQNYTIVSTTGFNN